MQIPDLYNYLLRVPSLTSIPSDAGTLWQGIGNDDKELRTTKDLLGSSIILRVMGVVLAICSLSLAMAAGAAFVANPLSGAIPLFRVAVQYAAAHDLFAAGCYFDPSADVLKTDDAWKKAQHVLQGSWVVRPAILEAGYKLLKVYNGPRNSDHRLS